MINDLFGAGSVYASLRGGLDRETVREHRLAHRIANATTALAGDGLAGATGPQAPTAPTAKADLEQSMVQLADTQLHFDATAVLPQKAYGQLRTALKND